MHSENYSLLIVRDIENIAAFMSGLCVDFSIDAKLASTLGVCRTVFAPEIVGIQLPAKYS